MKKQWMVIWAISKTLTLNQSRRPFCSSTASSSSFALKNVTKSNFESSLRDLRRHVRDADFVSIDLEMTGVTSAPWRESVEFDRSDVQYLKVKDSAEKFAVVQFGVCPFRWDSSKQSFVAHPHNFYVFPRQEVTVDGPSCEFLCQTTSIDFLAKYQFDFNVCINEGISYLSRAQENEAKKLLYLAHGDELSESPSNLKEIKDIPMLRMADILFTERMKHRINEWYEGLTQVRSGGSGSQDGSNDSNQQFQTIFFKMRPALKLNGFTSRQLRLIQLVTEKNFTNLSFLRVDSATCLQQVIVYTDSKKDRDLLMKEVKESRLKEAEMKIEAAVGFRNVIDLLSSERKLIVGHNCFLDVAHIYSKFLGPLPSTPEEYISSVHKYFPYIIDTKILVNASDVLHLKMKKSSTSLSKAFALLCPQIASGVRSSGLIYKSCVKVEVQVDDMRSSNWNSGAKHEAGYDAFMTGCVFAQACSHLGIDFMILSAPLNLALEEKLQKHINLLYLSWTNGEIVDFRTGRPATEFSALNNPKTRYPKILFPNIALIWGFSSKLKGREIRECLTKAFGLNSVTSIYHLDETAVFVQFCKAELVSDFLELKESLEKKNDVISVLHPLSKILEGGRTCAASYEVYKKICCSPISEVLFSDQAEAVRIQWKTKLLEPKIEVEMQRHGTFIKENVVHSDSDSNHKRVEEKMNAVTSSLGSCFQREEVFDSLYLAEAEVSR